MLVIVPLVSALKMVFAIHETSSICSHVMAATSPLASLLASAKTNALVAHQSHISLALLRPCFFYACGFICTLNFRLFVNGFARF